MRAQVFKDCTWVRAITETCPSIRKIRCSWTDRGWHNYISCHDFDLECGCQHPVLLLITRWCASNQFWLRHSTTTTTDYVLLSTQRFPLIHRDGRTDSHDEWSWYIERGSFVTQTLEYRLGRLLSQLTENWGLVLGPGPNTNNISLLTENRALYLS